MNDNHYHKPALGDEYDHPRNGRRVRLVRPATRPPGVCNRCVLDTCCRGTNVWGRRCALGPVDFFVYVDDIPGLSMKGELA